MSVRMEECKDTTIASCRVSPDRLYSRFPATGLAGLAQLLTQIMAQIEQDMAAIARFRRDHPDADHEARDAFYQGWKQTPSQASRCYRDGNDRRRNEHTSIIMSLSRHAKSHACSDLLALPHRDTLG